VHSINAADLMRRRPLARFQAHHYDGANTSINAPLGSGPTLHKHPYEQEVVVQEGVLKFTAGAGVIEALRLPGAPRRLYPRPHDLAVLGSPSPPREGRLPC
jgi:hypothetical protein